MVNETYEQKIKRLERENKKLKQEADDMAVFGFMSGVARRRTMEMDFAASTAADWGF
jgi:hypothetical protein